MTVSPSPDNAPKRQTGSPLISTGISMDRFPMLRSLFDALANSMTTSMRDFSPSVLAFNTASLGADQAGDLLDALKDKALVAIYHAVAWDTHIALSVNRNCVSTLVEAAFGGDGSEPPATEARDFSGIELRLAKRVFEQAGRALETCFEPVRETEFRFVRTETDMDFVDIGPRTQMVVAMRLRLETLARGGELTIFLPVAALAPMRAAVVHKAEASEGGGDPDWTRRLSSEVQQSELHLRAVFKETGFTLSDIAGIKVGTTLALRSKLSSPLVLEANNHGLFNCTLGQSDGKYTVRIESGFDE